MKIEELWFATDTGMPQYELELKRIDVDGEVSWRFFGRDSSDNYGEHHVYVDRKHLKDLHAAIEQELYPERYFSPTDRFKTTDPEIIAHEIRVENINKIFELMNELGIPEEKSNEILDQIQIVEHENRKGR